MGKKKRSHPDVDELLERPWCYYCERDFEDLKLLISHQKAKHFKCDRCGRRLNTAGGLSVHLNQVHKETLSNVENALPNRQGLDVEIFGMEGVPEDIIAQHNQRIIQNYYQAQADRRAATGNPPPGQSGIQGATKKLKVETADELKQRLAAHRAQLAARKANPNGAAGPVPGDVQSPAPGPGHSASPGAFTSPFPPPQPGFEFLPAYGAPPGLPGAPMNGAPPSSYPPSALPARPPNTHAAPTGLPQRPSYTGAYTPGAFPPAGASTLDDLVAGAARPRQGDDIDHLIRMAEAGIKPARAVEGAAAEGGEAPGKSGKRDKSMRMVYADGDFSLEEKMAQMARYAVPA